MTDDQLTALLRLKRYERPPAGYFDQLLADVHRRQRAELLRRPLWKIAVERVQVFFGEHSMGGASYAGAMAAVLVVGVGAISMLTPTGESRNGSAPSTQIAAVSPAKAAPNADLRSEIPSALVTLQTGQKPSLGYQNFPSAPAHPSSQFYPPRQVIDARPASYEPSPSFSF